MESGFGGSAPPVMINDYEEDGKLAAAEEFPPGFRFHPTDEEIIMHYLSKKVVDRRFSARAIGEADLNKCEPWDLPKKAKMGEKEWFFFCKKDRKYTTGMRTNRATELGYWKATGKDKEIYKGRNNLVGMKKTLVFYKGRAPKGGKTNWVMHEFRLHGNFSNCNSSKAANAEWVVCRVSHKNTAEIRRSPGMELAGIESFVDHLLDSPCTLPTSTDSSFAADNHQDDESKEKFTSQPRLVLDDHKSQIWQYNQQHQRNFLVRSQNHNTGNATSNPLSTTHDIGQENLVFFLINSGFPHEASSSASSIGCPHQDGQSSVVSSIPPNIFPFKGADQANLRLMAAEMEHFSCDNSMISHSQDTGLSAENMANEMTSEYYVERNQPFDRQLQRLSFSSDISDLDSLWSN